MPLGPWWTAPLPDRVADLLGADPAPVAVAVVDSGLNALVPDLAGRVDGAAMVVPGPGGWTFADLPGPADRDARDHGTAVAGLVARVAPNARLHDLRIFDPAGRADGDTAVAGLGEAVRRRLSVICLTAVCDAREAPRLARLCAEADRAGLVVVAPRRNVPRPDPGFPAACPTCLGVASGRFPDLYAYRYTGRPPIEFVAYGEGVTAPGADGGRRPVDGTSFAAGVLAGLCALIRGAYPGCAPFEVKALLRALAREG